MGAVIGVLLLVVLVVFYRLKKKNSSPTNIRGANNAKYENPMFLPTANSNKVDYYADHPKHSAAEYADPQVYGAGDVVEEQAYATMGTDFDFMESSTNNNNLIPNADVGYLDVTAHQDEDDVDTLEV